MRNLKFILGIATIALFLFMSNAHALNLGTNIAINDGVLPDGVGQGGEDQGVEWICVWDQAWDLEGFFLEGATLTMIGGYHFQEGHGGYSSGDIFIDVNNIAHYGTLNYGGSQGSGAATVQDTFGYEYALELDFSNNSYTLWKLDPADTTLTVFHNQNDESKPWAYANDGTGEYVDTGSLVFYEDPEFDESPGLFDGTHYAVSIELLP